MEIKMVPTIKNFLYSLNVKVEDGRTDIYGIMSAMTPEYIPGLFSFSISFTLLNISEEEHSLIIKFKDPDNNVIANIEEQKITYTKDENNNLPDEEVGISVAAGMQNVNLKRSGIYKTEVLFDGNSIGEYGIFAKGKNE